MARLPTRLADLVTPAELSVEAFNPEADIKALIEGNRTGGYRPRTHIYDSIESDIPDVNFGIDLRRWAGEHGWRSAMHAPKREKGAFPEVLQGLLTGLSSVYAGIPEEGELGMSVNIATANLIRTAESLDI
jgi:hypothetical protein